MKERQERQKEITKHRDRRDGERGTQKATTMGKQEIAGN